MPPPLLFDLSHYDLSRAVATREQIYDALPHRREFMLLGGVLMVDAEAGRTVAFADVTEDAWWTRGHLPGRPILPGVLMIEMAGQAAAYYSHKALRRPGVLAFAAMNACRFRGLVQPPCRVLLLGTALDTRPRRLVCGFQGLVDEKIVFEAELTGLPIE
jgi:3-hydroxyacyl-[acyl-carrier-protein] dehydratase